MRPDLRIVPVLLVITLAAACGDPPAPPVVTASAPASAVPASRAPTVELPARTAVTAALLTPAELGDGYTSNPALADKNPATGLNTSLQDCAKADPDPGAITAQQVYQGAAIGPFVVETVTATQPATASTLMDRLREVIKNCHQFDGEMAGGIKLVVTIDALSVGRVGDDTVAYRLTATVPGAGAALYAHMVTARSGGLVVLVSLMQMTSPDVAVTETMMKAAMAKAQAKLA